MIFHNATDIAIVVQVTQRLILEKFMFCVSHGLSSLKSLTPIQWVGPTRNLAVMLYMSVQLDILIISHFRTKRQAKNERFGPFQEGETVSQS